MYLNYEKCDKLFMSDVILAIKYIRNKRNVTMNKS